MKTSALLISVVILVVLLPAMLTGIDDFRLTDRTDYFTVASGATVANVTLTQDLYNDDTVNVSSITSNVTSDAANANTYTSATNVLNITGLDSTASHYLTIVYSIDNLGDYFGAATGAQVLPVLVILGIISVVGAGVYGAYSKMHE